MTIHQKAYLEELYTEHLEESAFLYENRLSWLYDEEVSWLDLDDIDERIDAHLDALVVGGELALTLCRDMLEDADFSQLHIIVRLFCRVKKIPLLSSIWVSLDFEDGEKVQAVSDALKWECPAEWQSALLSAFNTGNNKMFSILAPTIVYQHIDGKDALSNALFKSDEQQYEKILWALGRLGDQSTTPALRPFLSSNEPEHVEQAALSLLMLGDNYAVEHVQKHCSKLPLIAALSCNHQMADQFISIANDGKADANVLLAIGLSGEVSGIPILIHYLKHPDYADFAAQGLQIITGAPLYEDIHVVDDVDEDELFEHEIEAYKKGETPKNIDGLPYGNEMHKLTVDPKAWSTWIQQNQARFVAGLRYRNGEACTPMSIVKSLINGQSLYQIRKLALDELIIRYNLDITFEVDDLVYKQKSALNQIHQWANNNTTNYKPGVWYFSGTETL